ncbi:MAG TPA: hypothetical protein QGG59_00435 [Planctomycetota bacterium]|jgi:hypothetical protein|nr:hypothetical protein [Planctomycetota bacterium]MDP7246165.1 hypothetical protein [Planctomycetota bacterium]HJM38563.1 hypothetical protein [Planctomycetota bacterium]|tara:strand:- start:6601 stop:8280 length:1680 start_codon:yes stop_codon:yes gene_type:complete
MLGSRTLPTLLAILLASLGLTSPSYAQKVGRDWHEDAEAGFKFRPLKEWAFIPVPQGDRERMGKLLEMNSEKALNVKLPGNQIGQWKPSLYAFQMREPSGTPTTGDGGLRNRVSEEKKRPTIETVIQRVFGNLRDFKKGMQDPYYGPKEEKLTKKALGQHVTYSAFDPNGIDLVLDCWTISLPEWDVGFVWLIPEKDAKKYLKTVKKSMKTLTLMDLKTDSLDKVEGDANYESFVAYQKEQAAKIPGWRIVEVPSKRFLITTSSENTRFIKSVIERLEKSRDLYEVDFPPKEEITFVSMVRLCKDREELQSYGDTGPGTAGFFNPNSRELVLYDASQTNKKESFAVMSHEAFHQYCFFLFDEANAHRWFDEGQGDYYGAYNMDGKKPKPTAHMPGGLDRYQGIKEMVRNENYVPISRLIRMTHEQWYNNNDSFHGVASYNQSWSLVYFLRQGMRGEVSRRTWKKEYADIIPNYTRHLFAEFAKTKKSIRDEIEKVIEKAGGESALPPDDLTRLREQQKKANVSDEQKLKIWNKATAESWGKIDIDVFEEDWLAFVKKDM